MDTKWKNWTARLPVKLACWLLIPVLLVVSATGFLNVTQMEDADVTLLLVDLSNNDYFYDNHILHPLSLMESLFYMQSEEHIKDMGCLFWREDTRFGEKGYVLADTSDGEQWGSVFVSGSDFVSESDFGTDVSKQMEYNKIENQLSFFRFYQETIREIQGLSYLVTDGTRSVGNVHSDIGAEFFRSQPVYWIREAGQEYEHSRSDGGNPYPYFQNISAYSNSELSYYIAFSPEAVIAQNEIWKNLQATTKTIINQALATILAPALAALALIILLLNGAGRRYGGEPGKVYLTVLDKPWLDTGLVLLLGYGVPVCIYFGNMFLFTWRYYNIRLTIILLAVLAVCLTWPLLLWLCSLAKHVKQGRWWRHTMVYAVLHGMKPLWAGVPLTLKALAFGLLPLAYAIVYAVVAGPLRWFAISLPMIVLMMLPILRHAHRLHKLEQGAKAASSGRYDTPIAVTGGELGSIAVSINSISDGINDAVIEQLKSERYRAELITNISHDIRTPLTSLITYTDLLKNEGLDNEKASEYLEVLIQKSARLKTLTDDLFEAAKAASGNFEVHMTKLDLADFMRQILGEQDERLHKSGLDFRLSLPEHAPVQADGKLLWRVMDNLLSNVLKYTLPGSRVYIDISSEDEGYRLDIKNISLHPLNVEPAELLERFKRGDEARAGEGSGLGLSIAQSFVLSQNGRFALSIDGDLFKVSVYLNS